MAQTDRYTAGMQTIKEVVKKALLQSKKLRSTHYHLFYELAIDAYRYLRLNALIDGKTWRKCSVTKLTGGENGTGVIDLPGEYEDFIGIYIPLNGELWPLTRRDSIITTTSIDGILETQDNSVGEGVLVKSLIDNEHYTKGGVNIHGYYTLDLENQRIFINGVNVDEVILLYKTSGVSINSQTYVFNKYIPCMIAYILYESIKYDDNYPLSRREELRQSFVREEINLRNLEAPTLQEFIDAIYSTYYITPKR